MNNRAAAHEVTAGGGTGVPGMLPGGPAQVAPSRGAVPFGKRFQQIIITIHRWIGIAVCVMMFIWFISGLVLAYVRLPTMRADEKLTVLHPIEWQQVRVTPAAALAAAGLSEFPSSLQMEMSGGEAVYRITDWKKHRIAVSAETGQRIEGISGEKAVAIVREQLAAPGASLKTANVDSDQWTNTGYWNKDRPFHVVALNDERGMEYHVSVATGEIVLDSSRFERTWSWFGAIPHWLYFEFIRHYAHEGIWTWVIYALSGAGIFVAVSGLWIGFSRLRMRARYSNGSRTPFRGWMKWHHITGVLGGVFLALWIISGLLTMYPGGFLDQRKVNSSEYKRYAGSDSIAFPFDAQSVLTAQSANVRRVTLRFISGRPVAILEDGVSPAHAVDAATGAAAPLSTQGLTEAARALVPGAHVVSAIYLEKGDEWWHSGFWPKKTPILRVIFDDADASWFHIDPESGEVLELLDKVGRVDRWTAVAIHDVDWYWLLQRRPLWDFVLFFVTIPGVLIVTTTLVISYRRLQRANLVPDAVLGRALPDAAAGRRDGTQYQGEPRTDTVLVGFASQTGTAELLANKTADSLRRAGLTAEVRNLGDVDARELMRAKRAIFLVSTTGDGDAPDRALRFQRRIMRTQPPLHGLEYALLALGDQQYSTFCSFGNAMDSWLRDCGGRPIFPPVQVDDADPDALGRWSRELSVVTGRVDDFRLNQAPYQPWRLAERRLLNPGSAGWETFHLVLEPIEGPQQWQAGDIAQVVAGQSWKQFAGGAQALIEREYSIASIEDLGQIHLLVRCMRASTGLPGLASGLLTQSLPVGEAIPLRIRRNSGFHGPLTNRPMILIGNGTGLAGLRAHLMRRVALEHGRNWLIFGERNAATDAYYADDLRRWIDAGWLERVDLVFSRDQPERRYVQDRLAEVADEVRAWVDDGAAIYVCGSLQGMAPAVTERLVAILGEDRFDELTRSGRYCRDVY